MLLLYQRLCVWTVSVFLMTKASFFIIMLFLYYNVTVYISVQSEEEYSLIWKAKPLTIQTDEGKW